MMKKSIDPLTVSSSTFEHLSDVELLRLQNPVTGLECALYARLSSCLTERDALHADLTPKLESANDALVSVSAELAKAERLNSTLCDALELLKNTARAVIEHWDQGNLAGAVNDLRQVMDDL
jgi:hypothetical protein